MDLLVNLFIKIGKMNKEYKDLLIKDLSSRIFYEPIVHIESHDGGVDYSFDARIRDINKKEILVFHNDRLIAFPINTRGTVKPYLRPLKDMTPEELEELKSIKPHERLADLISCVSDFYHKYHLDYHRLLDKGLAIKGSKEMYK